jgi:putative polyhydroxyalkanoate system protein
VADIDIRRVHDLGRVAARRAAEQMVADLARKFDLRGQWQGDVLRFERPGVAGTLALTDKDLHLSISLGFLLKAMKSSIERAVTHELDTLFAHGEPPPAPPPVRPAKGAKGG